MIHCQKSRGFSNRGLTQIVVLSRLAYSVRRGQRLGGNHRYLGENVSSATKGLGER